MSEPIQAYPLQWPAGWPRKQPHQRTGAKFRNGVGAWVGDEGAKRYQAAERVPLGEGIRRVKRELRAFGVPENRIVISSDLRLRVERIPVSAGAEVLFQAESIYRETAGRLLKLLNGTDVGAARGLLFPLLGGSVPCRPAELGRHLIAEVGLDLITLARGGAVDELVAGAGSRLIHRPGAALMRSVALIRRAA